MLSEDATTVHAHIAAESTRPQRVTELDGLRGIAILAVFCHHVLFTTVPDHVHWKLPVRLAQDFAHLGIYGVDLFFVLSGFLITSILLGSRERPHYYSNFYWRRALRILPLYLLLLFWLAIAFPGTRRYLLLASVFLANFHQLFHLTAPGPFWTLSIEEQFYAVWPWITHHLPVRRLLHVSICLAGGCLLLRVGDSFFGRYNYRYTPFHCDGLAMGAAVACLLNLKAAQSEKWSSRQQQQLWLVASLGLVIVVLATTLPRTHHQLVLSTPFILTGVNLLGSCAVMTCVLYSGRKFLAILRSRLLVFFGLISYAVYMFNEYAIVYFDRWSPWVRTGATSAYFLRFFLILVITVVASLISRYALELPAMTLRKYVH
jgi:peptidoglycan/LPS O-acetylase OafA/YrhL